MGWVRVASLQRLRDKGQVIHREGARQLLVLEQGEHVHVLDNRCPHEGYPLSVGTLDGRGVLTCNWHNWKFRLDTGRCVLGEDDVRVYPVRVDGDEVLADLSDPPVEEVRRKILGALQRAFEQRQLGRMARELARLELSGLDPVEGLRAAIGWAHDRLEDGTTHAFAGAADWLASYRRYLVADRERRLICLTEALDHLADDVLRQPVFPYGEGTRPWSEVAFVAAVQEEDEPTAQALIRGALAEGLGFEALERPLARAALTHYQDFGHSLIYVQKLGELQAGLGADTLPQLLGGLVRALVLATREDRIPEFSHYFPELQAAVEAAAACEHPDPTPPPAEGLLGAGVNRALAWTTAQLGRHTPEAIHDTLTLALADNLLRFDEAFEHAFDRGVDDSPSWLNLTHGLTFSHAARVLCGRHEGLWTPALLQMACFVGRNAGYLRDDVRLSDHLPADPDAFFAATWEGLLDHGVPVPIRACHRLKTATAVARDLASGALRPQTTERMLAALARYLAAPTKMRHGRRLVRQGLELVERDYG